MNKQKYFLDILQQQTEKQWLININNYSVLELTQKLIAELEKFKSNYQINPTVLLIEKNNLKFLAAFLATIIAEVPVFLGNYNWQEKEYQQVKNLIQPHIIWGKTQNENSFCDSPQSLSNDLQKNNFIGIPTGGSSGTVRFAMHTTATLNASVKSFAQYFNLTSINSCCTLPLYHVSGLMQLWRSLISQGNLALISYHDLKQGIKPKINPQDYFLSLVPTQLKYFLDNDPKWLSQFKTILLGGAPAWKSLLEQARQANIPVATTYGMTETASGISYLKPQDFCLGNNSSGQILNHAQVSIIEQKLITEKKDLVGKIKIRSDSLFYGYYPQFLEQQKSFITDDLGFFDAEGFLHLVGRDSQKIITGGENVYPQEIEAAILATQLVKDVCVMGLEDETWGQIVIALFIPLDNEKNNQTIKQQLQQQIEPKLSKYKHPKYWLAVGSLFRDKKGKINYSQLNNMARKLIEKK